MILEQKKKEGGITLVALIITIIVLVILTAVTIIEVVNSNIINIATKGIADYAGKQENEQIEMEDTANLTANMISDINSTQKYASLTVSLNSENNIVTDFAGRTIIINNESGEEVKRYELKQEENKYTFSDLEIGSRYLVTLDSAVQNKYYLFNKPEANVKIENKRNEVLLENSYYRMYLYKEGDLCTPITGGYEMYQMTSPSSGVGYGTATVESDGGMKLDRSSGDNFVYGTKNAMDLSKFNKLYVDGTLLKSSNNSSFNLQYDKVGSKENWNFRSLGFGFHNINVTPIINNYPLNVRTTVGYNLSGNTNAVYGSFSLYEDIFKVYNLYVEK